MAELIRWAERLFLIPLSIMVIWRIAPKIDDHPQLAIFLISEVVSVVLLLTQRRGTWSIKMYPLVIALMGTACGLLVVPTGPQIAPDWLSQLLIFQGALIALAAKLFLGRSFGVVPANRGVKSQGVYRIVRHPMYAGYILNQLGFLLVFFSAWNIAIYALAWLLLYLRAKEEERFLEADEAYRDYCSKVRYRLIPGIA